MAAFNFPNSPSTNQTHTENGITFKWDGEIWKRAGIAGAQGSQGAIGAQGAQGHQGHQGAEGVASLTVSTSPPGSPSAGDIWWHSDDGDMHVYYNDGNSSQWVATSQGPMGLTGAQGAQGAQGVQGAVGAQGAQGHQGRQGATGAAGAQGAVGAQGAQGKQGAVGAQGAQGHQGVQGATGAAGAQGHQGVQGATGGGGSAGAQGAQGHQGRQGAVGAQGAGGSGGSTGAQGATGAQGHQGVQGAGGSGGGTGAQGHQGRQGAQGHQGNPNAFPSGTKMVFVQQNAPTGWTKFTTHNDVALRVISGNTGGTYVSGSGSFSATFAMNRATTGGAVVQHTLTTAQIPSHRHWVSRARRDDNNFSQWNTNTQEFGLYSDAGSYSANDQNHSVGRNTAYTGSGQSHPHGFTQAQINMKVHYVDTIIATKD